MRRDLSRLTGDGQIDTCYVRLVHVVGQLFANWVLGVEFAWGFWFLAIKIFEFRSEGWVQIISV